MRPWVLAAYALLVGSLLVRPLWHPYAQGDDDTWWIAVMTGLAHLGLGAGVRRWWALLIGPAAVTVLFLAAGGDGLDVLIVLFGVPLTVVLTATGWGAARLVRSPATAPALLGAGGLVLVSALVVAVQRQTAERLPEAAQRRLPLELSVGNLCPGASTPRRKRLQLQRQVDALVEELDRRPEALVRYTYQWSDEPSETRWITVRELAEEQRSDAECAPAVRRRLDAALNG